jgi:hypothetical protein
VVANSDLFLEGTEVWLESVKDILNSRDDAGLQYCCVADGFVRHWPKEWREGLVGADHSFGDAYVLAIREHGLDHAMSLDT